MAVSICTDRADAEDPQRDLATQLPANVAAKLRWFKPLVRNQALSAEVLAGQLDEAKEIADRSNVELATSPIEVKGKFVRGA